MRHPKPWFRASKSAWYVQCRGKKVPLGEHPDGAPLPKKTNGSWNSPKAILNASHKLMATDPANLPEADQILVARVADLFLSHAEKHNERATYLRYKHFLQSFCKLYGRTIPVACLLVRERRQSGVGTATLKAIHPAQAIQPRNPILSGVEARPGRHEASAAARRTDSGALVMLFVRWIRRSSSLAVCGLIGCAGLGPETVPSLPENSNRYPSSPQGVATPPATPAPSPSSPVPRGQIDGTEQPLLPVNPPTKKLPIQVPPTLPGANVPAPTLPDNPPPTQADRLRLLNQLFPELPALGPDPVIDGTAGAKPLELDELQAFARQHSPLIAQAEAEVEAARGQWIQAGLYPNPTAGFQGDQMGDAGSAGQVGGFFNQTIITGDKLKLARAVAYFDHLNAKIRLKRAEADLARQVRTDYYAALVAAENVRITRLMSLFTEDVYRRQVALLKGGQSAPFEASALRAVVGQARLAVIQSENRYRSAWRQLATTLNAPEMAPAPLAGQVDEVSPRYRYEAIAERILASHTDLAVVRNSITQAETHLSLERRKTIPDIQNNFYFQNDTQYNSFQMGAQIGAQVPVWNRNQGNIITSKASLMRLGREGERVRNDLLRQLADAYERYESARQELELLRGQILPDLVVAFRGVYQRYEGEAGVGAVNYNDIVNAQQNLSTQLTRYLTLLSQQWLAASDLAGLAQTITLGELLKDSTTTVPQSDVKSNPAMKPPPGPGPGSK